MNKVVLVVVFILVICALYVTPVLADQGGAKEAISSAQGTIKNCYRAVREAETAGANVESLTSRLNDAANLLSIAQLAYAGKDYNAADNYAMECQSQLGDFILQVNSVKANANGSGGTLFIVLSLGASVGLLCAGIAAWVVLGRKQRRIMHTTTPV
jgi:type II secretory pathway pseudopilin PulG